jgi:hypothetical protein
MKRLVVLGLALAAVSWCAPRGVVMEHFSSTT